MEDRKDESLEAEAKAKAKAKAQSEYEANVVVTGAYAADYLMAAPGAIMKDMPVEVKVTKTVPTVYHTIGISNVTLTTKGEKNIKYRGTGPKYHGSKAVLDAVSEKLSDLGLQCAIEEKENTVKCQGNFKEAVDAQSLAVFFRLLIDADLAYGASKPGAGQKIAKKAWDEAEEISNRALTGESFKDIPKINWEELLK